MNTANPNGVAIDNTMDEYEIMRRHYHATLKHFDKVKWFEEDEDRALLDHFGECTHFRFQEWKNIPNRYEFYQKIFGRGTQA